MQTLAHFKNKKILVLGAGLTGLSCVRFLQKNNINCCINDNRENPTDLTSFKAEFPTVDIFTGSWNNAKIEAADVLIVSPGVDLQNENINIHISKTCEVIGDVELFCQLSNIPTIAVTGSNGKSTVVSLLHYLGNQLGYNTELAGNIGVPVLTCVDKKIDYLVLELSSFQLETLSSMQAKSVTVLNVSDDHLDRHNTIEQYTSIKQSIYTQGNKCVFNRDDQATYPADARINSSISFGTNTPEKGQFGITTVENTSYLMFGNQTLIALKQLPLAGMHNALNYLAALALGYAAGWSLPLMVKSLSGFEGLPHRCQRIQTQDGVHWINDSKATNVGATLAAIKGLSQTVLANKKLILIAGGEGKGADFSVLKEAVEENVNVLYTLGKDGDKLAALSGSSIEVSSIEQAVRLANKRVVEGDIVLLSPACASIDMFSNFVERGNTFVDAVNSVQGRS